MEGSPHPAVEEARHAPRKRRGDLRRLAYRVAHWIVGGVAGWGGAVEFVLRVKVPVFLFRVVAAFAVARFVAVPENLGAILTVGLVGYGTLTLLALALAQVLSHGETRQSLVRIAIGMLMATVMTVVALPLNYVISPLLVSVDLQGWLLVLAWAGYGLLVVPLVVTGALLGVTAIGNLYETVYVLHVQRPGLDGAANISSTPDAADILGSLSASPGPEVRDPRTGRTP